MLFRSQAAVLREFTCAWGRTKIIKWATRVLFPSVDWERRLEKMRFLKCFPKADWLPLEF